MASHVATTTRLCSPSISQVRNRLRAIASSNPHEWAGLASIAAGVVHASVIGTHSDNQALARLFAFAAIIQIGWGVIALRSHERRLHMIGATINITFVGAWVVTRLTGVSWIAGLETREAMQTTDTLCAALGLLAAACALGVALFAVSPARHRTSLAVPATIAFVLMVPGVVGASTHAHGSTTFGEASDHAHSGDTAAVPLPSTSPNSPTTAVDGSTTTVAPTTTIPVKEYDPAKKLDLSGVPGVSAKQQARAEALVLKVRDRLPQFASPATALRRGYHSIRDGVTGYEHYINWSYINDKVFLDPDYPESLVYRVEGGKKTLVSAMFMMPISYTLETVPDIGGALTQWHIHNNLCFSGDPNDDPNVFVVGITNSEGQCRFGVKLAENPMIHVWIVKNACGPFAALEGVGAGQVKEGDTRACYHQHAGL